MQNDILAKRCQRERGHLEMLLGKRYAHNRHKQQQTKKDMHEPGPQTSTHNPKQVKRNTNTPHRTIRLSDFRTEWPQAKQPYLERL